MQSINPCHIIGEILGEPAHLMRNPVNAEYQCPFINSECTKRSQRFSGPYPVCSIYRSTKGITPPVAGDLIAVCPKRFMQSSFIQDAVKYCWADKTISSLEFVHEIKMDELGTVDFVIADVDKEKHEIIDFISLELQAVDITGSYEPAYSALLNNEVMKKRPVYGFNWANVRKRYITQLIGKGFFHNQWGTSIVSVLQNHVFERLYNYLNSMRYLLQMLILFSWCMLLKILDWMMKKAAENLCWSMLLVQATAAS
jgi:hypothetical protein